jgi:hypothetical protein
MGLQGMRVAKLKKRAVLLVALGALARVPRCLVGEGFRSCSSG